mmetsp:Transcript_14435/g.34466  ORF Transcript_14435/g.34466 Transcript_14435/m.34466 type:complete len:94 (+) Transcript_14435:91-372(+)
MQSIHPSIHPTNQPTNHCTGSSATQQHRPSICPKECQKEAFLRFFLSVSADSEVICTSSASDKHEWREGERKEDRRTIAHRKDRHSDRQEKDT